MAWFFSAIGKTLPSRHIYFIWLLILYGRVSAYTAVGRYGHSAVLMNNSIYFYGGDSSITASTRTPLWLSDLAVLNLSTSFALQQPKWSAVSGTQSIIGGPSVYYQVGFSGTNNSDNMFVAGGITPAVAHDNNEPVYLYNVARRQWKTLDVPNKEMLHKQGAAVSVTSGGLAYLWGGKNTTGDIQLLTTFKRQESAPLPVGSNLMYCLNTINPNESMLISLSGSVAPQLRYAHSQTLLDDNRIVVLGGFDGMSGTATSLADIWIYEIDTNTWSNIPATLSADGRPAARSSHSAVLMPDGISIVIYGGYDGYNVFNDVAVLNTTSWAWEVKSTTANVQGRADVTTLIGTNMIVAFGFTGVSTSLSILSDIENLDVETWSWRSAYNTSEDLARKASNDVIANGPSTAVIMGAVGGLAGLFCILLLALHICNRRNRRKSHNDDDAESMGKETNSLHHETLSSQDDPTFVELISSTGGTTVVPMSLARRGGQRVKRTYTDGDINEVGSFNRLFSTSHRKDKSIEQSPTEELNSPESPLEEVHQAAVVARSPQILQTGQQPVGLVADTSRPQAIRPHSTFDGEEFIVLGGGDERMMSPLTPKDTVQQISYSKPQDYITLTLPPSKQQAATPFKDESTSIPLEIITKGKERAQEPGSPTTPKV
ncbi:hypothetical protein INT43_007667 [Umbelopsis isabellina]|uniref:Galactose oxidase n=1 Tax=Mortierella isabellina TaxID=91625 RepID=A0A8H7PNE0_MORIS|nr:hypothetical protein INT43_007667 [Umbelopsis isabellina]